MTYKKLAPGFMRFSQRLKFRFILAKVLNDTATKQETAWFYDILDRWFQEDVEKTATDLKQRVKNERFAREEFAQLRSKLESRGFHIEQ
jgi:hypothetical protein